MAGPTTAGRAPMNKVQIRSRWNYSIIYEAEISNEEVAKLRATLEDWQQSWITDADLRLRATLERAGLDGASLVGASLVRASLDGASLDGARLVGARLDGASLVGASLDGARAGGASLVGARLAGARPDGA